MPEVCLLIIHRLTHVINIINLFKGAVKKYYFKMNNLRGFLCKLLRNMHFLTIFYILKYNTLK